MLLNLYSLKINLQKPDVIQFSRAPLIAAAGGCKQKVESRLTLKKEDSTIYHLVRCLNEKVSGGYSLFSAELRQVLTFCFVSCLFEVKGRGGKLDLTADRVRNCGSSNPAFSDIELHLAKGCA